MTEAWWCLRALLSHWRRSPFQLIALLLGLMVATALWSGVQAINFQARISYDKAAGLMGEKELSVITSLEGSSFSDTHFGALRRQGWKVSPILEGEIQVGEQHYHLVGIDPLSYPVKSVSLSAASDQKNMLAFIFPGRLIINPTSLAKMDQSTDAWKTHAGKPLPPAIAQNEVPPGIMIVDIAIAQLLLSKSGLISKLLISPTNEITSLDANSLSSLKLQLVTPSENVGMDGLTESFHLNLTAFGFLSFFVGLFIVHSAIGLAFEQRRSMIRTLRACGVSARKLAIVLIGELLLFALFAGSIGVIAGYLIAAALLPDVAASLQGLYGANVSGELSLQLSWWLLGLGMSMIGALFAATTSLVKSYRLPVLAPAAPNAWRVQQIYLLKWQAIISLILLSTAGILPLIFSGLMMAFAMMGCLLLGAALLLPFALFQILNIGQSLAKKPISMWFWADGQHQLSGLSMALMALFLALSVNIGVGTMVEGFRLTFLSWIDTRLVSEIYVRNLTTKQITDLKEWPQSQSGISALLPIWKVDRKISGWPTEIYGFLDHQTYRGKWALINSAPDVWDKVAEGQGILISEQMARKLDLALEDTLSLPSDLGQRHLPIVGIFPDYGNPKGLLMMNIDHFIQYWPDAPRNRFGIRTPSANVASIMTELREKLDLSDDQIIDQSTLKAYSISIFEKTFAITVALNSLTLIVAGIAILTGLLSLSQIRLPQLAPLWAMGITRKSLARLELLKSLSLAAFTALFAIPFGLLLAWCLVAVVNVEAFGWRLPLFLFPGQWLELFILALLTAFLSSLYPVYRLYRIKAGSLLKVFADER